MRMKMRHLILALSTLALPAAAHAAVPAPDKFPIHIGCTAHNRVSQHV
jgi:hypothetical protein